MEVAHDKDQAFMVDSYTCQAGKFTARKQRMDREQAEKAKTPEGWDDGKHYFVKPVDDDRERRAGGN